MPIACTQCSTALLDAATFCWRCGHVRRTTTTAADGTVAYEACEIVYGKSRKTGKMVFSARAMGDSGTYITAAESEPLKYDSMTYLGRGSQSALDRLLADLVAQGWESLGTCGIYYWDHRLRRRVAARAEA
jgi:hypothetical protein